MMSMKLATFGMVGLSLLATPVVAMNAASGWWNVSDTVVNRTLKRKDSEGAEFTRAYALCTIKRYRKGTEALLATPRDSEAARAAGRSLQGMNFHCMPEGAFTFDGQSIRGNLAEAMFWQHYADVDVISLSVRTDEVGQKESFADCSADADLATVRTLIATEPGSADETAQLNSLMPRLNECLAKTSFRGMDNASARALLAEALYRAAKRGERS
ncbi:hypothetical protein [Blastomonas aquatica]|uniref:Uncharacterized protein n=1 Tax=Blastomonas aquatica TaxID=1510276 RepID=A0ABQ1JEB2_9SPHN|nr:hypothetical protein [Blastomonas aquatica]GGB66770.1 hypothetical protein GCM10010833_22450 [Blastomonas aquatica]